MRGRRQRGVRGRRQREGVEVSRWEGVRGRRQREGVSVGGGGESEREETEGRG